CVEKIKSELIERCAGSKLAAALLPEWLTHAFRSRVTHTLRRWRLRVDHLIEDEEAFVADPDGLEPGGGGLRVVERRQLASAFDLHRADRPVGGRVLHPPR